MSSSFFTPRFSYKRNTEKQIRTSKPGVLKNSDVVNEHLCLDQWQFKRVFQRTKHGQANSLSFFISKKLYALC